MTRLQRFYLVVFITLISAYIVIWTRDIQPVFARHSVSFLIGVFAALFVVSSDNKVKPCGQATMNTPPVEPPDSANSDNDGFTWS